MTTTAFHEILATVRQTAAAHASALDELERAFSAQAAKLAADQVTLEAERGAMLQKAKEANARERVLIAEEREAVDRGRADLEATVARMSMVQPSSEDRFRLNVGGVRFDTSRTTLTKVPESMLATMFGARLDMLQSDPEDGSIFLDRDGERFGLILDFLRDGPGASQLAKTIRELPTEPQREAMLLELEFFGLTDAVFPRSWIEDAEFKVWGPKLNSMRTCCAAVLTSGRRVFVFGGMDGSATTLRTTEVLDLDTNAAGTTTFTAGPPMTTARFGCAAVRLDARRVLVVGGSDGRGSYLGSLDTTEILDLETMRFSAGPRMLSKRSYCTAIALGAQRILVAGGGGDGDGSSLKATEVLDVATMTFAPGPEMLSERYGCSAVALSSGSENPRRSALILIVGGRDDEDHSLKTTEVLDLESYGGDNRMTFSRGPTMRAARFGCAAVALLGGGGGQRYCLVVGGKSNEGDLKGDTTEVLDLETMEFTEGPAMLTGRGGCAAVAQDDDDDDAGEGDHRVFVLGGGRNTEIEVLDEAV